MILCYGHVAARAPRELVLAKVESDILRNIFQYFSTKVGASADRLRGGCHAGRAGVSLPEPHILTRFTFVIQVLGIKVETKVQCVGVKCELCLFSLLWTGLVVSLRGGSQRTPEHGVGACPHSPGSSSSSCGHNRAQELVSQPGRCWRVDRRTTGGLLSGWVAGAWAAALFPDAHGAHLPPGLTNVFPFRGLWH